MVLNPISSNGNYIRFQSFEDGHVSEQKDFMTISMVKGGKQVSHQMTWDEIHFCMLHEKNVLFLKVIDAMEEILCNYNSKTEGS